MNSIMHGYSDNIVLVYLDNIVVFSNNEDEHEAHLCEVFDWHCKHKLYAKLKKCEFGKMHMKYLDNAVGLGKLSIDRNEVAAVADW